MIPTPATIERSRNESLEIAKAIAAFWTGLVASLTVAGAKVERDTEPREVAISDTETVKIDNAHSPYIRVNGVHLSLDVIAQHKSAGRFSMGRWTGSIQVTHREYRAPNRVWKTRKTGWPFGEIASYLIERAEAHLASERIQKAREKSQKALQTSPQWATFSQEASALSLYPELKGDRVSLNLRDLSFPEAQAVIAALYRTKAMVQGNHERHGEILRLVANKKLIEAIKLHRDLYASSLKDAKDAVVAIQHEMEV